MSVSRYYFQRQSHSAHAQVHEGWSLRQGCCWVSGPWCRPAHCGNGCRPVLQERWLPVTASCLWPCVVWFPLLLFMMTHNLLLTNVHTRQNWCLANTMVKTQSLPHGHRDEYDDVSEEARYLGMGGIRESLVLTDGEDFERWRGCRGHFRLRA